MFFHSDSKTKQLFQYLLAGQMANAKDNNKRTQLHSDCHEKQGTECSVQILAREQFFFPLINSQEPFKGDGGKFLPRKLSCLSRLKIPINHDAREQSIMSGNDTTDRHCKPKPNSQVYQL